METRAVPIVIHEPPTSFVLPNVIEAQQFVVKSPSGADVAILGSMKDGSFGLTVIGDQKSRITLGYGGPKTSDCPGLRLSDANGKDRFVAILNRVGPSILMRDTKGETYLDLDVYQLDPKDAPSANLVLGPSLSGKSSLEAAWLSTGGMLRFFDKDGSIEWEAPKPKSP